MRYFFVLLLIWTTGASSSHAGEGLAGLVKNVSGIVTITNSLEKKEVAAVPNMLFFQGDRVKTGKSSSVGLIFEDDTVLSLGANTELTIEEFQFNPLEQELSFIARMVRGTFSLISGQIVKLAPEKVELRTPNATLGVRGTKLLVKVD